MDPTGFRSFVARIAIGNYTSIWSDTSEAL